MAFKTGLMGIIKTKTKQTKTTINDQRIKHKNKNCSLQVGRFMHYTKGNMEGLEIR